MDKFRAHKGFVLAILLVLVFVALLTVMLAGQTIQSAAAVMVEILGSITVISCRFNAFF